MVYSDPPWLFKGRSLYQLHPVKVSEARKFVPDNFKLVELFGYTLGGIYLAQYTDSPVGPFNELVVLGGLVWNPPTSCAWAARVYVDSREARDHGLSHVGLPSRLARFSEVSDVRAHHAAAKGGDSWWKSGNGSTKTCQRGQVLEIRNVERARGRGLSGPVVRLALPPASPMGKGAWRGPRISLHLPNFSGATPEQPALLHYTCKLRTRITPVASMQVLPWDESADSTACSREDLRLVLQGKPLVAFEFGNMEMLVDAPTPVPCDSPVQMIRVNS